MPDSHDIRKAVRRDDFFGTARVVSSDEYGLILRGRVTVDGREYVLTVDSAPDFSDWAIMDCKPALPLT